jgi:tetratricopeptide (TPR) repeat protein
MGAKPQGDGKLLLAKADDEADLQKKGAKQFVDGDYKGAEATFLKLLELNRKLHGKNSAEAGSTLNLLGNVAQADGVTLKRRGKADDANKRFDAAEKYYKEGLEVDKAAHGKDHPFVAVMLNQLATVDGLRGKWKDSASKYDEAIKIYEKHVKDPAVAAEMVLTLRDYADVLDKLGEKKKAKEQRDRADKIERTLPKKKDDPKEEDPGKDDPQRIEKV